MIGKVVLLAVCLCGFNSICHNLIMRSIIFYNSDSILYTLFLITGAFHLFRLFLCLLPACRRVQHYRKRPPRANGRASSANVKHLLRRRIIGWPHRLLIFSAVMFHNGVLSELSKTAISRQSLSCIARLSYSALPRTYDSHASSVSHFTEVPQISRVASYRLRSFQLRILQHRVLQCKRKHLLPYLQRRFVARREAEVVIPFLDNWNSHGVLHGSPPADPAIVRQTVADLSALNFEHGAIKRQLSSEILVLDTALLSSEQASKLRTMLNDWDPKGAGFQVVLDCGASRSISFDPNDFDSIELLSRQLVLQGIGKGLIVKGEGIACWTLIDQHGKQIAV